MREYLEDDDPRSDYDPDPNAEDRGYEAMRQEEMDNRQLGEAVA